MKKLLLPSSQSCQVEVSNHSIRAFSLTEILTVLVVVMVLVTILIAGQRQIVSRSQTASCATNLRNIGAGLHLYATDNGHFPVWRLSGSRYWFHLLEPYMTAGPETKQGDPIPTWLMCPGRGGSDIGYGYNPYFGHVPPSSSDATAEYAKYWQTRPSSVDLPSRKIIAGDNKDIEMTGPFSISQIQHSINPDNSNYPRRHRGGGNYLFVDGHVERILPQTLAEEARKNNNSKWIFKPFD